jgi:hypothetical protein
MESQVKQNTRWHTRASQVFAIAASILLLLGSVRPTMAVEAQPADSESGPAAFGLPWTPPSPAYRIKVDADGLYALSYAYLSARQLPVDTLDPRSFRLYWMGQEVPILVPGEGDGHFDEAAGDVLLFYGRSVDSLFLDGLLPANKYTKDNVYWLTYDCATGPCDDPGYFGLRMQEVDSIEGGVPPADFTHREHLEQSFWYFSRYPYEYDADHWYWEWASQAAPPRVSYPREYSFMAYYHPADQPDGLLTVKLLGEPGRTNAHHLRLWVNGNLVLDGSPTWLRDTEYTASVVVPGAYFAEGTNTVKVGLGLPTGLTSDKVYINWIDMTYADTYIAESRAPGWTPPAPGNWLTFDNPTAGTWQVGVTNFDSRAIEILDVTDHVYPRRIVKTSISGTAPHSVSFGVTTLGASRFVAVAPGAWRTPVDIEAVTRPTSVYTPADLTADGNQARYILITHRDFWAESKSLADHRSHDAGMAPVALVDVQQIYDQFNGGMMSAEAIRDFLAYAYTHWSPAVPQYVLLMGDGSYDMRKYLTATNTYIPPYLYLSDPDQGETAAENRFVTFVDDIVPHVPAMHLGRLPANTPQQAQDMVNKIKQYETACWCDGWNHNTLFLTDDIDAAGGGNFYEYSNYIADGYVDEAETIKLVPTEYQVQKEYLGLTCDVMPDPTDAPECRANIVTELNGTGALFVSYIGHALKWAWAVEEVYNKAGVVDLLDNGPCLPILLAMTCVEGAFHDAETPNTMAEINVREPVDGAIASFSPTGTGIIIGHEYLEKGLMLAWFHNGIDRLGASVTFAKQYLDTEDVNHSYADLLDTFILLGDPGLRVKVGDACLVPTAVVMSDFTAQPEHGGVRITWQSADESEVLGYNILRRESGVIEYAAINSQPILASHSGLSRGDSYSFLDATALTGRTYEYALGIMRLDGTQEQFGAAELFLPEFQLAPPSTEDQ